MNQFKSIVALEYENKNSPVCREVHFTLHDVYNIYIIRASYSRMVATLLGHAYDSKMLHSRASIPVQKAL
jgi:hypothetical protein